MSNTKQVKVLLLLAGYLLVVLSHIIFVQPQKVDGGNLTGKGFAFVSKNHNKFGKSIINVKKIYKTVVNRNISNQQINTPAELYVATLLYNVSWHAIKVTKNIAYSLPVNELPVKRSYHLRI